MTADIRFKCHNANFHSSSECVRNLFLSSQHAHRAMNRRFQTNWAYFSTHQTSEACYSRHDGTKDEYARQRKGERVGNEIGMNNKEKFLGTFLAKKTSNKSPRELCAFCHFLATQNLMWTAPPKIGNVQISFSWMNLNMSKQKHSSKEYPISSLYAIHLIIESNLV